MNILIVAQYFWPENFRINDLTLGSEERDHYVEVLTGIPNYPVGKFNSIDMSLPISTHHIVRHT